MNPGSYNRKISAIWSADVAGYSRLMGDDEEKTVQTLTRYRQVMSDLIAQHRGRVVDSPGGIHLSGAVYDLVKHKLPFQFEFTGQQAVKNIQDPVRAYRVVMGPGAHPGRIHSQAPKQKHSRAARLLWLTAAIAVLGLGFYYWVAMHARTLSGNQPRSSVQHQSVPRKASIAVLPFKNLSGDSQQEYFSDGITNDIITDLSRFHNLLVIASNTVFLYKGQTVNIQNVGRELGVRYILEGSVQKAGDSVRINAQLIDVATGSHIWAERYSRAYRDIFTLQGDIVQAIVTNLAIKTFQSELARAMRKKPQDL